MSRHQAIKPEPSASGSSFSFLMTPTNCSCSHFSSLISFTWPGSLPWIRPLCSSSARPISGRLTFII
ncbi:hypothetical protein BE20_19940 [Sorangium cellulosum]|nr:hypothetical protein BE20_19940 [Sorangium cellulosum]